MPSDDNTQDLHLIFQTAVEDIRFAKNQEWRMTYYALILMSGVGYLHAEYDLSCNAAKILIGVITIFAIVLIICNEIDIIRTYRPRMRETNKEISEKFQDIFAIPPWHEKWYYKFQYPFVLCGTLLVTFILLWRFVLC